MDIATLGLKVDSSGVRRGKDDLDSLSKSAGRAEKSAGGLSSAAKKAGVNVSTLATAAARSVALLAASYASFQGISASIGMAREFNAAVAETSTLIEGTPDQIRELEESARSMAREFGGNAKTQVEAYYQSISAGATSVGEATKFLDQANKLAVGGASDVTTAVGVLSGVLNSYGKDVITAAEASDALFVGVKAGVTTISELGANLGKVIPSAEALGVSFDEVVAATAALTKNSLSTSVAATSLNAAFTGIIKPTEQAKEAAKALGLEFSATALQSKGLVQFLQEVVTATDGDVEALSQLFGSVEALKAAMLLAGPAGKQFTDVLAQMENKAGATTEAYEKMASSFDKRWSRATAAANDLGLRLGNTLLTVVVPAMEGAVAVAEVLANNMDILAVSVGLLAVSRLPAIAVGLYTFATSAAVAAGAATALAVAMNLIPFVAVATGVVLLYRAYRDLGDTTGVTAAVTDEMRGSVEQLNNSLNIYATTGAVAARDAAIKDAKAMEAAALATLANVEAKLALAKAAGASNPLFQETANQPGGLLYDLGLQAAEARIQLDNARQTIRGLAADTSIMTEGVDGATGSMLNLSSSTADFASYTYTLIPAIAELREEYGNAAYAMRDLLEAQNAVAQADLEKKIAAAAMSAIDLGKGLELAANEAAEYYLAINDMAAEDSFAGQAQELVNVANQIAEASGGLANMSDQARIVYDNLLDAAGGAAEVGQQVAVAGANTTALGAAIASLAPQFAPAISSANTLYNILSGALGLLGGIGKSLASLSPMLSGAISSIKGIQSLGGEGLGVVTGALGSLGGALKNVQTMAVNADGDAANFAKTLKNKFTPAVAGGGGGGSGGGGAAGAVRQLNREIERLEFDADPMKKFAAELANLNELSEQGLSDGAYAKAVDDLNASLVRTSPVMNEVNETFGDMIDYMVDGFKDGMSGIVDIFKNMLKNLVSMALRNRITIGLGASISGVGGAASAAGALGAPAGGGLLQSAGSLLGLGGGGGGLLGGLIGTWGGGSGILGGISTFTGALANGGLGNALGSIPHLLSGATTGVGGLGAAIGGLAVPVLGITAAFSFFRTKTKLLDAGIRLTGQGADIAAEQFKKLEKKKFWGLSKKVITDYEALDASLAKPIKQAYKGIYDSIEEMALTVGVRSERLADRLGKVKFDLSISTNDMSEEEALEAIQTKIGEMSDKLASQLVNKKYIRAGETAIQALTEMSASFHAVSSAFQVLGMDALEGRQQMANAMRRVIEGAGGLQGFDAAVSTYFQSFYTLEEQITLLKKQFVEAKENFGILDPLDTNKDFRNKVDELRGAGRDVDAAELITLAPLFDQIQQLKQEAADAGISIDGLNGSLSDTARDAASIAQERAGIQQRIWQLRGKDVQIRRAELMAVDSSNRALLNRVFQLEKATEAEQRAAAVLQQRQSIQKQIWQLQGNTEALRRAEIKALPKAARADLKRLHALQDATAAAQAAAQAEDALSQERGNLQAQLWQAHGNTKKMRNAELKALDRSNRALQRSIYLLEDRAAAEERAAAVAQERQGIQAQIWELEGNTAALRNLELSQLDASNRGLKRQYYALVDRQNALEAERQAVEDVTRAIDEMLGRLRPEDFASKLSFQQAQSRIRAGQTAAQATSEGQPSSPEERTATNMVELKDLMRQLLLKIEDNTRSSLTELRFITTEGLITR